MSRNLSAGFIALTLAALQVGAFPSPGASQTQVNQRTLEYTQALDRLWTIAPRALGVHYGCVLEPGIDAQPPHPNRLILEITSRRYRAAATRAISRAKADRLARIGYVAPRDRTAEIERITSSLERKRSRWPEGIQLQPGSLDRQHGCPTVTISVTEDPRLVAAERAWATAQQIHFGADRIMIASHSVNTPVLH